MTEGNAREVLRHLYWIASNSPDPSTQNAAAVLCGPGEPLYASTNNAPPRVQLGCGRLKRPQKYYYIEHAERAAIFGAVRSGAKVPGSEMFACWASCADCARAIVWSGVKALWFHQDALDRTPDHWLEPVIAGMRILSEGGVDLRPIKGKLGAHPIRFNGEMWAP